jgi:hypothetical protein
MWNPVVRTFVPSNPSFYGANVHYLVGQQSCDPLSFTMMHPGIDS